MTHLVAQREDTLHFAVLDCNLRDGVVLLMIEGCGVGGLFGIGSDNSVGNAKRKCIGAHDSFSACLRLHASPRGIHDQTFRVLEA